ncbi:MAG: hypothetical protein ACOVPB_04315, partial [Bacteroidia bacterium]
FLEQFFDKNGNKVKEIIFSQEGEEEQTTVLGTAPSISHRLKSIFFISMKLKSKRHSNTITDCLFKK